MFGSIYVADTIYTTLSALTAVTDAVSDRIFRKFYPQEAAGYTTPFIVYELSEPTIDDGPLGQRVSSQTIRFIVYIADDAADMTGIIDAAEAFDAALQDLNVTVAGKGWNITCRREGEVPDFDPEWALPFVRLGGIYAFDVNQ